MWLWALWPEPPAAGWSRDCRRSDWIHLPGGMTRINVKIKAQTESELNGRGPDITPEAMEQLYAKLDALREGDILVLAGSLPGGLPSDT